MSRRSALPATPRPRPTWQAALLLFLLLAPPAWLLATLAGALLR